METEQNPETQGNSTAMDDTANKAESITSVMDAIGGSTEPNGEPAKNSGENPEGKKETDDKPENPKWMAQLGKDTLENADIAKQLSKFKSIDDLGKSYSELEKKLGNTVTIPGENASDEEKTAFYQKLGRPESADGYSIEGEDIKPFKEAAFKHNLTDAQAHGMFELLTGLGKEAIQKNAENLQKIGSETDAKLREEWGNEYQPNLQYLKKAISTYGGNALGAKLKASGLLYDYDVVKMLSAIGRASAESTTVTKGAGGKEEYVSSRDGGTFNYNM